MQQPLLSRKIELHASLTNRIRDSRNRFVYSWQLRCFLGLITSKSAAIAFPGTLNANQRRKIKLGSFAGIWKKDQSTNLESERNLRMKRERKEVSLQLQNLQWMSPMLIVKLFISPVVIFAFTTGEVIEDKVFLRPFFDWNATTMKLLGNLQLPLGITRMWYMYIYMYVSFECCAPLFRGTKRQF